MSLDTATENLPDVEGFLDTTGAEENDRPAETRGSRSKTATRSGTKANPKAAAKAPSTITSEVVREVLEVRGALEGSSDGTRALLVSTLKVEDDLDALTAAVIASDGAGGILGSIQDLRAKVTSEDPSAAFSAAVQILTMGRAERTELWAFAHERGLVEAKRVPVNESKAATDLAEALKNLPDDEMDAIAGATALLER